MLLCRKESQPRETVRRQRETKERESSVKNAEGRCQAKVDSTVQEVILIRLKKNSILMNEISENTLNEELHKFFLVNIQFRENYTRLSTTRRSRI